RSRKGHRGRDPHRSPGLRSRPTWCISLAVRAPIRAYGPGRNKVMTQPLLIIMFDEKVAAPDFATLFEVIAPMSPSGLLAQARGSHDGRGHRHHVRRLPGLQTRFRGPLPPQYCQLAGAPIKSRGIPTTPGVTAHV